MKKIWPRAIGTGLVIALTIVYFSGGFSRSQYGLLDGEYVKLEREIRLFQKQPNEYFLENTPSFTWANRNEHHPASLVQWGVWSLPIPEPGSKEAKQAERMLSRLIETDHVMPGKLESQQASPAGNKYFKAIAVWDEQAGSYEQLKSPRWYPANGPRFTRSGDSWEVYDLGTRMTGKMDPGFSALLDRVLGKTDFNQRSESEAGER